MTTSEPLPAFRYHPDPIGSVKADLTAMLLSLIKFVVGTIIGSIGLAGAIAFGVAKYMK